MDLFSKEKIVGVFRGFSESGLEFCADLSLPYKSEFQNTPMHGQFLLVQLETPQEAVLGRITSISSQGRMSTEAGEDYGIRAFQEDREVDEDLRSQYLKYKTNIRILGVVRTNRDGLVFAASHRRLPHVGSKVAFLSDEVLKWVANDIEGKGADLGFLAFGEFIHSGNSKRIDEQEWMRPMQSEVIPKFDISQLISRRTFVFARAGFGKSNLIKVLFSNLYDSNQEGESSAGTIIFDRDGEYFWPDSEGRPGLCDVPHLQDKLVVFTNKESPSEFYGSFVADGVKLDIRRLSAGDVVSIALPAEKQEQQNVIKLRGLDDTNWSKLVDAIYKDKNSTADSVIAKCLSLHETKNEVEINAARSNMTNIVKKLHDPSNQTLEKMLESLANKKICVMDVSMLSGPQALELSGLILSKIFNHNQEEFTKANPKMISTIAVVEEAQSVLNTRGRSGEGPYISWVKEGRKYGLGAVLVTQQPGSIPDEILSQGDNWFMFHLLSQIDLKKLKSANSHFSDDILSSLLNEPIPGHCVFWSSAQDKPYPLPVRVLSFEKSYSVADATHQATATASYATKLKSEHRRCLEENQKVIKEAGLQPASDLLGTIRQISIIALRKNSNYINRIIKEQGIEWIDIKRVLEETLPEYLDEEEKNSTALGLVDDALNEIFGKGNWKKGKVPKKSGSGEKLYVTILTSEKKSSD